MDKTTPANTTKRTTAPRMKLECLECGKTFTASASAADVECPKCHGVDVEVR